MENQNILTRVRKVVVQTLYLDESEVQENSSIQKDLGADSLDEVSLLMAIQDEFGIEIPDDEAIKIKTVEEIVAKVSEKLF